MKVLKRIKNYFKSIKIKGLYSKAKKKIIEHKYVLYMALPFILMELIIFIIGTNVSYINYRLYAPILFTIAYIMLFLGLALSFKKWIGKTIYLLFCILFLAMFLTNGVYFSLTKTFFDFTLMESASEGAPYILDTLKNCNIFVYLAFVAVIVFIVIGFKKIPKVNKNNYKLLLITLISFIFIHTITPFTLGSANKNLEWSNWKNARNIYNAYNDSNKSIKISGFYEYTVRNFYITFFKSEQQITDEEIEFLNTSFEEKIHAKNSYTGKLKGKNLIIVQLEGIDNWVINKNDTPTLYNLMKESVNFTKHYSYYNGGGSTFNSEFAVNTGFITPLSYNKNAYTFNRNNFKYSLANIFKDNKYSVNAFHKNTGEYYSRTVNYLNWGFENYYGLIDVTEYKDGRYDLDRELMLNEKFNTLMFPEDKLFLDYIITYSNHMPFTNKKGVCKLLYDLDREEAKENNIEFVEETYTEEECVRRQAKETDYMVSLLMQTLEEKNLLDNTAIVFFADHYLYTLEDKTILDKYKNTSNNLINNTPFFIWSKNLKPTKVNKVTSQLNILPTILNLYGISYNENNYIGTDALDKNYKGYVFFSDYSWYDGNVYVENGSVTNNKKISSEELENKNYYINKIINKNDLALKYNYFKLESETKKEEN